MSIKIDESCKKELLPLIKYEKNKKEFYNSETDKLIEVWKRDNLEPSSAKLIHALQNIAGHFKNYKSLTKKEKWYDKDCEKARINSFKNLKNYRKNYKSQILGILYHESNAKYKLLCKIKKKKYFNEIGQRLTKIKSTKEWWDWVKDLKNEPNRAIGKISSNEFRNYFLELMTPSTDFVGMHFALSDLNDPFLDEEFSVNEIELCLANLKDKKAPGIDRLPVEFFKNGSAELKSTLTQILNKVANNCDPTWKNISIILPFFKKGSKEDVRNYRGISLIDSISKIYSSVLNNRLSKWVNINNKLEENQAGFRNGYSTVDNLFCFDFLIRYQWFKGNKKVFCFFVDFKAAFDCVNRSAMFYKLQSMGVSRKFIEKIKTIYTNTTNFVWDGSEMSDEFQTVTGVKQGCIASPLIFALILNDLVDAVGGGIKVRDRLINMLMYADDVVFFSETAHGLQLMINRLSKYCQNWGFKVNITKSQVMVCRQIGTKIKENFFFNSEKLKIVDHYNYLGIKVKYNLTLEDNLENRIRTSKINLNSVWNAFIQNNNIELQQKIDLFNAVARSGVCYGSQFWGFKEYDILEKFQRNFIKRVLYLPQTTPNYAIRTEIGTTKIFFQTLKSNMNYIHRIFSSYHDNRFPKIFAKIGAELDIGCFAKWKEMSTKYGLVLNFNDGLELKNNMLYIIRQLENDYLSDCLQKARSTNTHGLFHKLNYLNGHGLLKQNIPENIKSWLIKARLGMVGLNNVEWRVGNRKNCSICNLNKTEDVYHFLGECPIYKYFRKAFLGQEHLNFNQVVNILNGVVGWGRLYTYLRKAWAYRSFLVEEYNS
jgi:hypothetical protein